MENERIEKAFTIKGTPMIIRHTLLKIKLRATFGTSHSSTTSRTNSLIEIAFNGSHSGYGEVGLPPKKPGCYVADPTDIIAWLTSFFDYLEEVKEKEVEKMKIGGEDVPEVIAVLFNAMDTCPDNVKEYSVAARNGFEAALYDLLGKFVNKPVYELLFGVKTFERPCFYSLGMGPEEETIKNLEFAMKYTHFIKVKLNSDVERAEKVFKLLDNVCNKVKDYKGIWAADMNTGGSVEVAMQLLERVFKNYKGKFYMLEQPFPLVVPQEEMEKWKEVKKAYESEGFLIYGDESISNTESIEEFKEIVSGVNLKLEKCGGFRGALKCYETAQKLKLKIWIGIMVGTSVLSTMAAMLSPISSYDDCAGDLLVSDESQPFEGGFIWDLAGGVIRSNQKPGLGLTLKK